MFLPPGAQTCKVDICLCAMPIDAAEEEKVESLIQRRFIKRRICSVNFLRSPDIENKPIAIPIEAKKLGAVSDNALWQLGNASGAQWRNLELDNSDHGIKALFSMTIQGHDWVLYMHKRKDTPSGPPLLLTPGLPLGHTRNLTGIYQIFASLRRILVWANDSFWPQYKRDILYRDLVADAEGREGPMAE
jgi:hypothetical protein